MSNMSGCGVTSSLTRHLRALPAELRIEIYKRIWEEHEWTNLKKGCECYVYDNAPSHSSYQLIDAVDFSSFPPRPQNFQALQYSVLPYVDLTRPLHTALQVEYLPHDLRSEFLDAIRGDFVIEIHESYYMDTFIQDVNKLKSSDPSKQFGLNVAIVFDEFTLNSPLKSGLEYLMRTAAQLPQDFRLFLRLDNAAWTDYELLNRVSVETGFSKRVAGVSISANMRSFTPSLQSRFPECKRFHEQQLLAAVYDVDPPVYDFVHDPDNWDELARLAYRGIPRVARSNIRLKASRSV